ncbi:flagellar type III secretion system pore protein FliP [Lachnoclostridium phytofermentans]|uniref:Flagellar biosynthetic protein FliP n=1 Tax=Lachnoclostridium phytofermentans (strain ATCC 700394 / DSM 18823 / ISDg) TaxID=357809 RepID=A9KNE3_LACP7|nr:flagellar type III secretion system pore protein FliP [Lachnoclostridium phytofermentans]ABX43060.1 flagellar biosynthetic protein FliP [Lachnoclostridium phytofermentans ISDg]
MTSKCNLNDKKIFLTGLFVIMALVLTFFCVAPKKVYASEVNGTTKESTATTNSNKGENNNDISFSFNSGDGTGSLSATLKMLLILTLITLAPSILIMLTSFIRIIVVLHFVRSALGTQTTPPNQVLIGLALFLTLFIMSPIITNINTNAVQPLSKGEITQEQAFTQGMEPLRDFMFDQTNEKDMQLFLDIAGVTEVNDRADVPSTALIPAFIISELRAAFIIGFLIYIPFLIIDMVVASTLMSMGMMMLPPTTISMPFKILLFIMADGWNLIIGSVIKSFY